MLSLSTNCEGRIVMLELFMLFLLLPYFYLCIYLLYLFILFLMLVCLFYGVLTPLSTILCLIVAVSFLVEETRGQEENQLNFVCTSLRGLKYLNHK